MRKWAIAFAGGERTIVVTRCCQTCRWFRADADGKRGVCANPAMMAEVGLQLEVHQRELRCRTGWEENRWEAAHEDVLLDIRWLNSDRAANGHESLGQLASAGETGDDASSRLSTLRRDRDSVIATDMVIDW